MSTVNQAFYLYVLEYGGIFIKEKVAHFSMLNSNRKVQDLTLTDHSHYHLTYLYAHWLILFTTRNYKYKSQVLLVG
jgi:hypothetical protein